MQISVSYIIICCINFDALEQGIDDFESKGDIYTTHSTPKWLMIPELVWTWYKDIQKDAQQTLIYVLLCSACDIINAIVF